METDLRFLPPSKLPAHAVHELRMFAATVYNSRNQLLANWCCCNARGLKHDYCLYGRIEAIGRTMGWDFFFENGGKR